MGELIKILNSSAILNVLIAICTAIFSYLKIQDKIDVEWKEVLKNAINIGVTKTYQKFVRGCKEEAEDRKLNKDEVKAAVNMALRYVENYGKEQGKDLVNKYGSDILMSMIEETVGKLKNNNIQLHEMTEH